MIPVRILGLILIVPLAVPAAGQAGPVGTDTVRVAAGAHYGAGGLHRSLFGRHYRDLWTAAIAVPVVDLRRFAAGLTATTAGGGLQTKSLRFRGGNGLHYGFRSVDKDPAVLPPAFENTFVEDLIQDQTSSAHPAGPALVSPLMTALGIPHPWRTLVVLPDDPALGEYRERFRGVLGFLSRRPIVAPGVLPFLDADEILDDEELFPRLHASPDDRIDVVAFLKARLFDVYIGDWDRHRGQWTWARFGDAMPRVWVPLPEDRDQAFVRFDGLMLSLARLGAPQLTNFGDDYPDLVGATWNGRELDRWLLTPVPWVVWDSVAAAMEAALTDSVLGAAVAALPPEYQALDGAAMRSALAARRAGLRAMARRYFRMLNAAADLHGTEADELVTVEREEDGALTVALAVSGRPPHVRRRFAADETRELRVYLYGGNDRVLVRGHRHGAIALRVVPGTGTDEVVNAAAAPVLVYTADGDRVEGAARVDRRRWDEVPVAEGVPHRDWGAWWRGILWAGGGPDVGAFLGAGVYGIGYGFRHDPYATKLRARAGWATGAGTGRVQLTAEAHRAASRVYAVADLLASGIEILNFHGFGNAVPADQPRAFYKVNHRQLRLSARLVLPVGDAVAFDAGPVIRFASTRDDPTRFLATLPGLYGAGNLGQVTLQAGVTVDTRDVPAAARRGVHLRLRGEVTPSLLDVVREYSSVEGQLATYLTPPGAPFTPTLALRAGGRKLFGTFPFYDAAFLGGEGTVRLGRENRYAGQAAVWGNAELRLDLARVFLLLPARVGIFGLADAGRVFVDGDPAAADQLHTAFGGGVWLAFLNRASTLRVAVTRSDEARTGVYVGAGFSY